MCSARGQHRCYGGNDLACHHASVSALPWTEVTELLSAFCRERIYLLNISEKLDFLKSEEGVRKQKKDKDAASYSLLIYVASSAI